MAILPIFGPSCSLLPMEIIDMMEVGMFLLQNITQIQPGIYLAGFLFSLLLFFAL